MTAIAFASEEALVAAITAELIPVEELGASIRHWRTKKGVFVVPDEPLRPSTVNVLVSSGARSSRARPPKSAAMGMSWLEAVSTAYVGEPSEPPSQILFELPSEAALLDTAGEMIRLGCDRQRYALGERCFLLVDSPPYFSVLRALEPRSPLAAYGSSRQPDVWVEIGFDHPLAERATPGNGLLLVRSGGWSRISEPKWHDIDALVEVSVPGDQRELTAKEASRRLQVNMRLAPTGMVRTPMLWVLRDKPFDQIERLLHSLPSGVVDSLLFAVGAMADGELVVLRAREGAGAIELAVRAERYAGHPQLASVMLPCDRSLEPPIGRQKLLRLVERDAPCTHWLRARQDGGFDVESARQDAFRPLAEWIDYVISKHDDAIRPWVQGSIFELDELQRAELVYPTRERSVSRGEAVEEPSVDERPARKRKKKATEKRARKSATPAVAVLEEPSADAMRVAALEQAFLACETAADHEERLAIWARLGEAYIAAGQRADAVQAWLRVCWEAPNDAQALSGWLAAEGVPEPIEDLLRLDWPTPRQLGAVIAQLCIGAPTISPEDAARFVDQHIHGMDVRGRWLAQLALSRLVGGDSLRLTRARDRALGELRGGLSLDRDVPGFLRARATGHGDLLIADVLVTELEKMWSSFQTTKRKRSAIEAPFEVSMAYASRLFAYGFARLGMRDRATALMRSFDGVDRSDAVHKSLLGIFEERVQQAVAGMSPTSPLSRELTAQLNELGTFERYKVDRLREVSRVLEPVERLDAVRGFQRGEADPRGDVFAELRALEAGPKLSARVETIVTEACAEGTSGEERAVLLDGAMDFFFSLPVSQATALLERLVLTLDPVEPLYRAMLVEEALVLAAHFGHDALADALAARFASLIGELGVEQAPAIASVLDGALRTLRRVGLRERAAHLLESVAALSSGGAPDVVIARVHVAGGLIYLGENERAEPMLAGGRAALDEDMPMKERLELVRAMAGAAALSPAEARITELRRLQKALPSITDSFSTNSHFCLSLLHYLESLVTGLVPPDRGRDGPAAAYLDEDEHLVRRRIHRDLTAALTATE